MNWLKRILFGCDHPDLYAVHLAGQYDERRQEIVVNLYCPECGCFRSGLKCESPELFSLKRYKQRTQEAIGSLEELK